MKHLKKSEKKNFVTLFAKILFIIEAIVLPAILIYMAITQLFPLKYLLLLLFLTISIIVFHVSMLLMKSKNLATKIISLVLSVIVLLISSVGTVVLGTIHTSISKIPDSEVEAQKI